MARLSKPVNSSDHILGSKDAAVLLVEYGDLQCPHCREAYPILQNVIKEMGDQMGFVFRHFPLTESHPMALAAAEATEAAAAQGKFWEMHNLIYRNQDQLDMEHLRQWAQEIGLDMDQFDQALQNHTYEEKVRANFMSGVRSGVNGTPTLFINGSRYNGPIDEQSLFDALQEAAHRVES